MVVAVAAATVFEPDGSARNFQFGDENDFYNYAPVNYIQLPQTRYQMSALGHFDVSEKSTVFGSVMFTSSKVPQQLAATPIFQTSTFTLDGNPFLDARTRSRRLSGSAAATGFQLDADGNQILDGNG